MVPDRALFGHMRALPQDGRPFEVYGGRGEGEPEMPISENELMWTRSLPEEVEADGAEVVGGALTGRAAEVENEPAAAEEGLAEPRPVVRVEAASALEATLARLEMNSLAIKLHLDALDERIGRMEPHLHERPRETVAMVEPVVAKEITEARAGNGEQPAGRDGAEAPALSDDAKQKRWSHLIGPELEALMSMHAPAAAEAPRPESASAPVERDLPGEKLPLPGVRPADVPVAAAVERPLRMSAAADRSGELPVPAAAAEATFAAPAASDTTPELPVVVSARREGSIRKVAEIADRAAAMSDPDARESRPVAHVRSPIPDPHRAAAIDASRQVPDDRREAAPAPRRMFSAFEEPRGEERSPAAGPKMWRGYRVRRLVWAVVLLVLAALPLVIWWRLSTEARDADAGDAAMASQVVPGATGLPGGKPSAGEIPATTGKRALPRALSEAGAGTPRGNVGIAAREGAAPVIRRPPAGASELPPVSASDRRGQGGRTSSGTVAAGTLGGQPGGADEVPGSSGVRVRVPGGVMAGHLLPTGDTDELPRGSGEVLAAVFISNTGRVEGVEVISGKEGLRQAAARTMRNWRYEPYVQDGVRVPVVTTASIRFGGESAAAR